MANRFRSVFLAFLVALGLATTLQVAPAAAQTQVDVNFFYDRLAPYGHWFNHPRYGWAWYPANVEVGWRPYTHGHWVSTAEYGWYWDSDYEWGWAPFHYGRWFFDDDYGWVWVPGPVWGPAWVAWRSGGGYIGWAPLPPEAVWQEGVGFGGFSVEAIGVGPAWSFCEERDFADPRLNEVIVPPARNVTIINRTTNITNYVTVNNRIVNRSVDVHQIESATHTRITPVSVREVDRAAATSVRPSDHALPVYRPAVKALPRATPPMAKDLTRRQAAEQAILKERHAAETEELTRRHETETRQNPKDVERLKREQAVERQALQHQQEQEQRQLQRRQTRCRSDPAACEIR